MVKGNLRFVFTFLMIHLNKVTDQVLQIHVTHPQMH